MPSSGVSLREQELSSWHDFPDSEWNRSWLKHLAVLGIAAISIIGLLWPTALSLIETWHSDSSYSYGFLVVPIAVLLGWRRRKDLIQVRPQASYFSLLLIALAVLLWLLGNLGDVLEIQQFAFIGILDCLVLAVLGSDAARILIFSLSFVLFAVPTGQSLIGPLQQFTGWFTASLLRLCGIPVVLEDHILSLPRGSWEVAEACSGIRYLTASVVVGILFAGLTYRTWRRRVLFVMLSIVGPILANGIRASAIVLLGYLTNGRLAAGVDHVIYGWVFFFLVTLLLLAVGNHWKEEGSGSNNPPVLPLQKSPSVGLKRRSLVMPAAFAVILVATGTSFASRIWTRSPSRLTNLILQPVDWVPVSSTSVDWAPALANLQASSTETLISPKGQVSVYIAYYSYGQRKLELVNSYNAVADSGGWQLMAKESRRELLNGRPTEIMESKLQRGSQHRLVWFWYSVGDVFTSNAYQVKFCQAKQRLLGSPRSSALVAVSAAYYFSPSQAEDTLRDFLRHVSFLSAH